MLKIIKLGNYACNFAQAYVVVDKNGIAPTVLEQHGGVTGVIVNVDSKVSKKRICKEDS